MKVIRTERIWLKSTKKLKHLCHISKTLFNEANYLVRQAFFTEKKWIQLSQFQQEPSTSRNFQQLPVPTAQKVLQLVDKAWKSFFAASADWKAHPEKFFSQPRNLKYKSKDGQFPYLLRKTRLLFRNGC